MNEFDILKKYFGYDSFREGQHTLISSILKGQDVLGIMPTGAGKSICYQVPALLLSGITVVISPLISLMKDQVQSLNQAGIHAAYINSSLTDGQISKALQLAAAGRYKIIYVAPERLETYEFQLFAERAEISMVTVDEAHCISQWGQDFRPSYLKIVQFIRGMRTRPIVSAFTATATEAVKEDIACVLGLQEPQILTTGFDRENLYFGVETPRKKDAYILGYIKEHSMESGVIYCATRKNVDMIYEKLLLEGTPVTRYHAGLGNEERKQNQDDFIYDRKPVMVATNAFGMGIDKSNVRYVIHCNMPQSLENYYQEAGRAGRDGEPAECILLYSPQDVVIARFLMDSREAKPDYDEGEQELLRERDEKRLQTMISYCMTKNCLREYILRYFGEFTAPECGNCSNCLQEFEQIDITEDAKKIISCIRELHQRYGINVIAGTLSGANTAKLREYGVTTAASYASMAEKSEAGVKQIINQMMMDGIISHTEDKYALLRLTAKAGSILDGEEAVFMKLPKDNGLSERYAGEGKASVQRKARRSDILNSKGLELFDRLREVRLIYAKEQGTPPYIIFSDKTLVDMCVKLPFDREEMLTVSGVGENKFEKYGSRFLEEILRSTGGVKEKYYFGDQEETAGGMQNPDAGETAKQKRQSSGKKQEFSLTLEQAQQFPYAERYLLTEIAVHLSELRDENTMKKIAGTQIQRWLEEIGFQEEKRIDGKWQKIILEKGMEAGLVMGTRTSKLGNEYEDIFYDSKAQKMILDHFIR
ncbi:MAG: DNA helicase RecQ [Lachnospiraceae bacterium]|nr:DNA helicase RecQ [Lachnospiraceae bacterium]